MYSIIIETYFSDAYTTNQLDYKWLEGSRADKISVKDEHLSQMKLIHTDALKDIEYYPDGEHLYLINPLLPNSA